MVKKKLPPPLIPATPMGVFIERKVLLKRLPVIGHAMLYFELPVAFKIHFHLTSYVM